MMTPRKQAKLLSQVEAEGLVVKQATIQADVESALDSLRDDLLQLITGQDEQKIIKELVKTAKDKITTIFADEED